MKLKRIIALLLALVIPLMAMPISTVAEGEENQAKTMPRDGKLRRPISPEQPMWIVHIDTWNNADPDKIIDLIPEDVLPYVVFNISMSINYDHETHTGSRNWEKARQKVVKEQRKIADQRKDFHHKLSRAIADNCTAFICEDLAVKNMMKNRHLAKAITSVGWSQFLTMVKYKMERAGK